MMHIKTPPSTSPFAPLAAEQVLLEFHTTAREYRIRVLGLFLAVAAVFGVVTWRFFQAPVWEALLVTAGLALFMLQALPRSRFIYRFTPQGVESAETTGDMYGLHRLVPLLGGIAILLVLVFSLPPIALAYTGFACSLALFLASRLFPAAAKPVLLALGWADIGKVTIERAEGAMLLSPVAGVRSDSIPVFTPGQTQGQGTVSILDTALALVREHAGQAVFEDGVVIR